MVNLIITLYTGNSISTYLYHHLIIGKYGIIKKRTVNLCKELFLSSTWIWLSKITILLKKLKYWMKLYWLYLIISFPIKCLNLISKTCCGWRKRIHYFWRKDQNLIRNTTMSPQIITKIWCLIRQMNVPDLL